MKTSTDTSPESRAQLLRQVSLFAGLQDGPLTELAVRCTLRRYRPGSVIFNEGDEGDALYLIVDGSVRIERTQLVFDSGLSDNVLKSTPVAWRRVGEHFGEMALLDGEPRMADAVAVELTELLRLGRADFVECVDAHPIIARAVMAALADRLRQAADQIRSVQSLDVLGRLSELLLSLGNQYGESLADGGCRLRIKLTHESLAEQMGVARESVSRAWSSLKQSGAVDKSGGFILIRNADRLRRHCLS